MTIDVIEFNNEKYPAFQSQGFAAKFAFPFAQQLCTGDGYDIGCSKIEWALPNATPIDITLNNGFNAYHLPAKKVDYIFSSHCLEHLYDWVAALDYWYETLHTGGVLFLYLPHYDQQYWRPWNNRKHIHAFEPKIIYDYMVHKGYVNIFYSERDMNHSFMIVGEKHGA